MNTTGSKIGDAKLEDQDDEDVNDVVIKLEQSFGISFPADAFIHVKTFGELCDVFEHYLVGDEGDECTSQHAFYRIRNAIAVTQRIPQSNITTGSLLSDLFPGRDRKVKMKQFQNALGIDLKILDWPVWVCNILVTGVLISFVAFFLHAGLALLGLVFFTSALWAGGKVGNTFTVKTVRELAEKITRENYAEVRRVGSVNKNEIFDIIADSFSHDLSMDRSQLTRDAKFGWK